MSSGQSGYVTNQQFIRSQVLRGLALNREPGYHFVGNFLEISFDRIATEDARLTLDTAPHCVEADGQINLGAFAVLADLALAATVRADLDPATRLGTVNMNLNFTGARLTGRLEAARAREQPRTRPASRARLGGNRNRYSRAHFHFTSGNSRRTWRGPTSRLNVL